MASTSTLVDRVKIIVQSSGTGPFQLGAPATAYRGTEALLDGQTYSYAVESDAQYEVGTGVYISANKILTRSPTLSSDGGAPVPLPAGVQLNFTLLAQDVAAEQAVITVVQSTGRDPSSVMSQAATTAALTEATVTPVDETPALTMGGAGLNGGQFDPIAGQITIPAGQTGALSFATFYIDLHREIARAGETVVLDARFLTSLNFLQEIGNAYVVRINAFVTVDGVVSEQIGQGINVTATQISANEVRLTGEYILKGGEYERAGLSLQIAPQVPVSPNERFLRILDASYRLKSETADTSAVTRRDDDLVLTSGDIAGLTTNEGQDLNGAVAIDDGAGLSVPSGSAGNEAYRRFIFDAAAIAENIGSTVVFEFLLRTSENLTDQTQLVADLSVWHNGVPSYTQNARNLVVKKLNSRLLRISISYRLVGDETDLGPFFQISNESVTRSSDGTVTLEQLSFRFEGYSFVGKSPNEQILRWREQQITADVFAGEIRYSKVVTVKPDGSGDFPTLAAAIAARGGGRSYVNRTLYRVYEGVYTDTNVFLPNFADVVGIGQRDKVWFKGELPDSVNPTVIPTVQTLWYNETNQIRNIKVTARNMRYPIHSDSGASANRAVQNIVDCYVEHYGNQGARDYQISIGGDPNAVWASEHAWGCGTHSGQKILSVRTDWVSPTSAFYFHTNADFEEPCYVELEGGAAICTTDTGAAIIIQALGSGTPDRLIIKNVNLRGPLLHYPTPWLSLLPENQRGDRTSEIEVHVAGCDPIPFTSGNGANILELRSIDAAGSSVAVSGSAAIAMFGSQPDYVPGGVGYPGRVRSQYAITGTIPGLSLGARLGNCTTTSKILNIVFDGTVNRTLTLNQNYTGLTNAQVVSTLNTALNGGARIFQELDVYPNTNHLFQPEHEVEILNTGTTSITRGMPVAFNGSQYKGRLALAADPATQFAGIVLSPVIVPGAYGRVMKPGGRIHEDQAAFNGAVSAAFGDTFGVSTTPGLFVEGAVVPLLRCVEVRNGQGIFRLLGGA